MAVEPPQALSQTALVVMVLLLVVLICVVVLLVTRALRKSRQPLGRQEVRDAWAEAGRRMEADQDPPR